jgi:hypothetical protein
MSNRAFWTAVPLRAARTSHKSAHAFLLERRLIAYGSPEVMVQLRRKQELK